MKNVPIEGKDLTEIEPVRGVFHVAGIIRSPYERICIHWEIDNSSGTTHCEAWRGQYELDCLMQAGYKIKALALSN